MPEPLEQLARASRSMRAVVEPARAARRLAAEEDVGGDGQLGDQVQLLVDDPDAGVLGVARAGEATRRRRRATISPS